MTQPSPSPLNYASPVARKPKTPLAPATRWAIALLCLLGGLCLAIFAFVPLDSTVTDPAQSLVQIRMLRPGLSGAMPLLLPAGFVLPLAAAVLLLARRRVLFGILLLLATGLFSFVSLGRGIVHYFGPWTVCDELTTPDGEHYCFMDSSFLQGQTMAIARRRSSGLFYQTLDLLGTTNGDSPRSYLLVVRPSPPKAVGYGALYATPDGLLVGLRHDNACYLVYDLHSRHFFGHSDVEQLSPFLLLGDKSQLHAPDEANLLKASADPSAMGLPSRQSLDEALTHPNPAVRQLAARLLSAHPSRAEEAEGVK